MATTGKKKFTNHLANEKSPYLLQHANNPVNWYPWGKEAFEKAREEKKLIFLSVGYSTCHWCHVMEHESFENEEIGDILNKHFISIKVDREERPDVDKVYMMFVQATTGSGGWPMSVWLTPDLEPVVGGTYFPPDDQSYGRPGFKTVLRKIAGKWQADSAQMVSQGSMILGVLKESLQKEVRLDQQEMPGKDVVDLCYSVLHNTFDKKLGGFGTAPKFPSPVNLNFLFRFFNAQPNCQKGQEALHMGLHTLRMMANGGMYDHVAQGFHRYSTDNFWHVPHFEKMLYDQAQLVISYLNAYQITKDEFFADVAKNVLEYVSRDLADPSGGFYSAEDADSYPTFHDEKKREGAFCVWTHDEVETLLNQSVSGIKMADLFCEHYCVQSSGNVDSYQDPHGELKNQNVLIVKGSIEKTAKCFCLSSEATKSILHDAIKILFEERKKRPRPDLDNKMIAAYNGMMMSGFAQAGQVLGDALFTGKAESIAQFLHTHLYQPEAGKLLRSCYLDDKQNVTQTSIPIEGFVDDYAFVIRGLLDLYEATFDEQWLKWANQLQHMQNELFLDTKIGGYFSTADTDPSIVLRIKDDQDGSEPSANSVSAFNLLKLAELGQSEWRNQVSIIMKVFQERLTKQPFAVPELTSAFLTFQQASKQIIIAGEKGNPEVDSLLQCIHSFFIPNKLLLLADGNEDGYLYKKLPQLKNMQKKEGLPTAFICENFTCSLPVTSISKLEKLLKESTVPNLFST